MDESARAGARERKRLVLQMLDAAQSTPRLPEEVAELGRPGPSLGRSLDGEVRYFTVTDDPWALVFRVRWADGGLWLEGKTLHGWMDDPSLLDYFIGKAHGATEIDEP